MDFIYNKAYHSGGRWHVVEDLQTTEVPESVRHFRNSVINWGAGVNRQDKVEGVEYYEPDWQRETRRSVYNRVTGRYETVIEYPKAYPIRGWVEGDLVTPAHMEVSGVPQCGLTSGYKHKGRLKGSNLHRVSPPINRVRDIGKTDLRLMAGRVLPNTYQHDPDVPPEPLCEHCRAKYGL